MVDNRCHYISIQIFDERHLKEPYPVLPSQTQSNPRRGTLDRQRICTAHPSQSMRLHHLRAAASAAVAAGGGNLQDKMVALCRHRGFVFPGSDIYGGLANSFDYGPLGTSRRACCCCSFCCSNTERLQPAH
jgi:hypothetical protein